MATVDSLDIQIQGSVQKASRAVDELIGKLGKLARALNFKNNLQAIEKQFQTLNTLGDTAKNVSANMKTIKDSMNGITDSIAPQVQQITKTITRLANAGEKSTEASKSLPEIGSALKKMTNDMSGISGIDSGVNKLVSSIARLANAGDKSAVVARELPRLGDALKKSAEGMRGIEGISDSTNSFTQAIAQLASAGDRAGKTASGLDTLSKKTLDFFNTMKNAPEIRQDTIQMTQAMAQLSSAGGKVSTSMKPVSSAFATLSKAVDTATRAIKNALKGLASIVGGTFSKIGQIGLKASNTIKKVASDMVAAFSRITHSSKGIKTASSNLGTLLKTIVGFKGIQGLFNFGKNAIKLGSNITEVENVVDTAFGSMAKQAYDFASTAKEQFGLSELAAKQYSGTMMAMLKSSGVAQSEAAKMSTTLAGLAGDIASFYNIETDEAFYKLRSAISGETEPMKALGVNMNIVNLEAFAMSRGINKAYKEMSLAEQATLRYDYILAKTTDAQGDFAKTAGTYANQVRLLKLNIESISGVVGQGLIAGILPAIKALNALMEKLMQAAKVFKNFMYTLMGYKPEGSSGGSMGGLGDISGDLEDIGDSAEEAGKKIKDKLFTLSFDELNILSDTADSLDESVGGIDTDFDVGDIGDFEDIDTEPINKWAQRIREAFLAQDWEELGKTIAELVNVGLQKVYDAVTGIIPKVENALRIFAEVFNSFVEWLDWDLLGRTIGAGVNLITTSINALLGDGGIDFENLGEKLSAGLRGMIDEIDWTGLGNAIGNWFMVAWRIADGFIQDMWRVSADTMRNGWEELGIAVGEAVNGVFDRINFEQIARVLADGFRGILEAAASALETIQFDVIAEKINVGLEALSNGIAWENIGEQITNFTAAISKAFNDLLALDFGLVGEIIGNGITAIVMAFNQLTGENGINFELLGANIADGLRNLFASIPWEEFGNALGNGFMVGWRILDGFVTSMAQQNNAGLTGWAELGISIGNAINGIFDKVDFGAIANILVSGFNGVIEFFKNFIDTIRWNDIAENLTNGINNMIHGINWVEAGSTLSYFVVRLLGVFQEVAHNTDWEGFGRGIGEFLSNIDWMKIIGQVFDILWTVFSRFISGLFDTNSGKVVIAIGVGMATLEVLFRGAKVVASATSLFENIQTIFGLIGGLFSPTGLIIGAIVAAAVLIIANWDEISEVASNLWNNVLVPLGDFLKDVFVSIWEDMLSPALSYIAKEVLPPLAKTLENLWSNVLVPLGEFIATVLAPVFEVLIEVLGYLWKEIIVPVAESLGGLFASALSAVWALLNDLVIPVLGKVIEVLQELWEEFLKPIVEWIGDILGPILEEAFKMVGDSITNVIDTLTGLVSFLEGVVSGCGDVLVALVDMIGDILGNLGDVFSGVIDFITGVFTGDWEKAWDGVVKVFKGIFNLIPSIAEGVINSAIGFINGIIRGINNVTGVVGIPSIPEIPKVELPRFEMGGFPEDGLFFANHNELVGQFSNGHTAVANNAQIVEGIKYGVREAVAELLAPYLADIAQNTRETADKNMLVRIGDRDIVESYERGKSRSGYQLNQSYV